MSSGVISSRSDYAVGQTLDTSFNLSASPFTNESQIAFINAFIKKKTGVDPDAGNDATGDATNGTESQENKPNPEESETNLEDPEDSKDDDKENGTEEKTESEETEVLPEILTESGKVDNQGRCEMYCTLVQKEKDRTKALGVDGSLDMSYGPVSGDANLKLAMNNIQGSLQLTVVVRAKQEGRIIKNELPELVKLKLRESVTTKIKNDNYTIDDFKKEYGSYLIFGFDYGGEINFTSTYSTNSSQDKMSVGGGLTVKYKEMGFNIKGSVQGNYSSDDVSKSTNIETKYTISPSFNSDLINGDDGIIALLDKISDPKYDAAPITVEVKDDNGDITETITEPLSAILYSKMQKLLGGDTLDPVKAIIYPIEKIGIIADAFTNIESAKVQKFCKAMNPLYQTLKEILKAVVTMDKNYDINDKPKETINLYLKALEINIKKMEVIENEELDKYAGDWYTYMSTKKSGGNGDDKEIEKDEFYKIDKNLLESQFNKDLFDQYNEMMRISGSADYDANITCKITLKGNNGKYVYLDERQGILNNGAEITESAIFISVPRGDDNIALYLADGCMITDNHSRMSKTLKPGAPSDNGTGYQFKVIASDNGKFGLQSFENKYLSLQSSKSNDMHLYFDQTELNEMEQFEIRIVE